MKTIQVQTVLLLRVAGLILLMVMGSRFGYGQGTFHVEISGFEVYRGGRYGVSGGGSLQLSDNSLSYNLFVPVQYVFPREAHFHGPAVNGETPIISLAPFEVESGGVRYNGALQIPQQFVSDVVAGQWYINLHSTDYETGVLSGVIVPVPEPGVGAVFGFGAMVLIALGRWNRR